MSRATTGRFGVGIRALAAVGLVLGGCTPGGIWPARRAALLKQVRTRGLIAGMEGLQPYSGYRIDKLTRQVAGDLGLAHSATSGNYLAHLPIIKEAHKHGQPVYLVGYSMGGEEARRLAETCKAAGIPVRILFLLDPRYMASIKPGTVPDNVLRVVFYTSSTYDLTVGVRPGAGHLADPARTSLAVRALPEADHMALPAAVTPSIRREIAGDLGR